MLYKMFWGGRPPRPPIYVGMAPAPFPHLHIFCLLEAGAWRKHVGGGGEQEPPSRKWSTAPYPNQSAQTPTRWHRPQQAKRHRSRPNQ